jgi:hypothetical protein
VIGYSPASWFRPDRLSVPLFLFYGSTKGAFLATEAASSLGLYLSKSVTFERFGALTADVALKGLIAGSSLMSAPSSASALRAAAPKRMSLRLVSGGIMLSAALFLLWSATAHKIPANCSPPIRNTARGIADGGGGEVTCLDPDSR